MADINTAKNNRALETIKALLSGEFFGTKPTGEALLTEIGLSLYGVDLPLDIRDAAYDVTHLRKIEKPGLRIGIDILAFVPFIGALKYTDEAAAVLKRADKTADVLDDAGDAARKLNKVGDAVDGVGDAARRAIPKAEELKMSQTVQKHINDIIKKGQNAGALSRPYIDSNGTVLLLQEIMEAAEPVQDEFVDTALRWDVPGIFRGTSGTWELVVDTSTNTVLHFNFVD